MAFGLDLIERETPLKNWMKNYNFVLVQSIEELQDIIDKAIKAPYCAFDLESTGLDTRVFNGVPNNRVVGYSLAYEKDTCYYIPIRHKVQTDRGRNLPLKETNELIQKLMNEAVVVGHNWLKFDAEMMMASDGIQIKTFKHGEPITYHDSYILARLAGFDTAGLKALSKKLLNKEMIEITEVVNSGKEVDFGSVSPYEGLIYAASDAICTKEIFEHPEIQAPIKQQEFIYNLERKVLYVVRNMERNQIKLNKEFCQQLDTEINQKIDTIISKIFKEVSEKTDGKIKEFKLDSPADVSHVFFDIFDMNPKPEKGKNGSYKTDDEVLEKLAPHYEVAKMMQEYRMLTKFSRTYIKNMLQNVSPEGYLKFQFSALQTDSGRFASPGGGKKGDGCSGVNIQAMPARYDKSKPNIRKCLSCEEDEVFVAMDWAGVELRVGTNLSEEPIWLDRFLNGDGDIHTSTASIIYDKSELDVDKEERQIGKTFNFQSLYGGGPGALASTIGITMDDAKDKQQRFFGKLTVLKNYIKALQRTAQKNKFCSTRFGRRRALPEYDSGDQGKIRGADRKAVNTPIQGTAADLMKIAMVKIDEWIEANNYRDIVKMAITMHDELCFRIKKKHVDLVLELEEIMKLQPTLDRIKWKVPLAVDIEIGSSWDIEYDYPNMLEFVQEKFGADKVAVIYEPDKNYNDIINEFGAWLKSKKEAKKVAETKKSTPVDSITKTKDDFKKMGDSIVKKETEMPKPQESLKNIETIKKEDTVEITEISEKSAVTHNLELSENSLEGETASASNLESVFGILKEAKLSDLPLEAHTKLKKNFYREEFERILSGKPSFEDEDIEIPIIVHAPIDDAKKKTIGYIIESCPGNGKIKFITTDKVELHDGWINVDILKATVMAKIYNL
jgi:DNA polymerase-1